MIWKNENLLNNIKKEAVKIPALSSGKTGEYEYLIFEQILPSDQNDEKV